MGDINNTVEEIHSGETLSPATGHIHFSITFIGPFFLCPLRLNRRQGSISVSHLKAMNSGETRQ